MIKDSSSDPFKTQDPPACGNALNKTQTSFVQEFNFLHRLHLLFKARDCIFWKSDPRDVSLRLEIKVQHNRRRQVLKEKCLNVLCDNRATAANSVWSLYANNWKWALQVTIWGVTHFKCQYNWVSVCTCRDKFSFQFKPFFLSGWRLAACSVSFIIKRKWLWSQHHNTKKQPFALTRV